MKNKYNIFIILFSLFLILVNIFAIIKAYNLSYYNCDFNEINNHVIFSDINIDSELYRNGAQIGDTIIAINNIPVHKKYEIKNKYLEYFPINDTVIYTIKQGDKIFNIESILVRRFTKITIFTSLIFSFLFIFLSFYLYFIVSDKSPVYKFLFIFYLIFSSIVILTHVPFRSYFLYSLFIVLSGAIFIILFLLSQYFYKNTFNKKLFFIFLYFDIIIVISWLFSYIKWSINLTVQSHKIFIINLRFFHIFVLIIVSYIIIVTLRKILYQIKENESISILISSSLFSVLLLIFPIIYSIPISIHLKELIPFNYYYYLYILPLIYIIITVKSNKKS